MVVYSTKLRSLTGQNCGYHMVIYSQHYTLLAPKIYHKFPNATKLRYNHASAPQADTLAPNELLCRLLCQVHRSSLPTLQMASDYSAEVVFAHLAPLERVVEFDFSWVRQSQHVVADPEPSTPRLAASLLLLEHHLERRAG